MLWYVFPLLVALLSSGQTHGMDLDCAGVDGMDRYFDTNTKYIFMPRQVLNYDTRKHLYLCGYISNDKKTYLVESVTEPDDNGNITNYVIRPCEGQGRVPCTFSFQPLSAVEIGSKVVSKTYPISLLNYFPSMYERLVRINKKELINRGPDITGKEVCYSLCAGDSKDESELSPCHDELRPYCENFCDRLVREDYRDLCVIFMQCFLKDLMDEYAANSEGCASNICNLVNTLAALGKFQSLGGEKVDLVDVAVSRLIDTIDRDSSDLFNGQPLKIRPCGAVFAWDLALAEYDQIMFSDDGLKVNAIKLVSEVLWGQGQKIKVETIREQPGYPTARVINNTKVILQEYPGHTPVSKYILYDAMCDATHREEYKLNVGIYHPEWDEIIDFIKPFPGYPLLVLGGSRRENVHKNQVLMQFVKDNDRVYFCSESQSLIKQTEYRKIKRDKVEKDKKIETTIQNPRLLEFKKLNTARFWQKNLPKDFVHIKYYGLPFSQRFFDYYRECRESPQKAYDLNTEYKVFIKDPRRWFQIILQWIHECRLC